MAGKTHTNVSAAWKKVVSGYVKVSGVWKDVYKIWVRVAGVWKQAGPNDYLPANSIILFDGVSIPAGWTDISAAFGSNNLMGAGSTYSNDSVGGSTSVDLSGTSNNSGSHASGTPWNSNDIGTYGSSCNTASLGYNPLACGGHTHTFSKSITSEPTYKTYKLIQCANPELVPVGGILLSHGSITTGLVNIGSSFHYPKVSTTAGTTGGVTETAVAGGTIGSSSAGAHSHGNRGGSNIVCSGGSYGSPCYSNVAYTGHSHTFTLSYTRTIAKYVLTPWRASVRNGATPNVIALWESATPPTDWVICDGTSGTPDLRDQMIALDILANVGQSGANLTTVIHTTDNQGTHNHYGGAAGWQDGSFHGDMTHSSNAGGHVHDSSFSSALQLPPFKAKYFIMYTGQVMIFTIERLDQEMQVSLYESETGLDLSTPLSLIWQLGVFMEKFPSMPYEPNIESVSFEPERGLFHVGYSGGEMQSYPTYRGHPTLEWVMNNYDAIYASALTEAKSAIEASTKDLEPPP